MNLRDFPLTLFPVGSFQAWPAAQKIGGGAALAGPAQTVDWSAGGWWVGEIGGVELWTPDHFRVWRAMLMHHASGGQLVMPFIDDPQRPMDDPALGPTTSRFNDGTSFSDGSAFAFARISFELAEPAREGDTTAIIRRLVGRPLLGGEYWSFDHPEARHRVYCIEALDDEDASGRREVQFGVPLRTDLDSGAFADFERPRLTMEVAGDPQSYWPNVKPAFEAEVGFRFIESFDYL
ncbi:hypothetical protein [Brevundimonas sp.]|uniref:hypothetical protein n=1 Tax=Brevundimonas sp. TaxID=1871086 RepID=UPI0035B1EFF5